MRKPKYDELKGKIIYIHMKEIRIFSIPAQRYGNN